MVNVFEFKCLKCGLKVQTLAMSTVFKFGCADCGSKKIELIRYGMERFDLLDLDGEIQQ